MRPQEREDLFPPMKIPVSVAPFLALLLLAGCSKPTEAEKLGLPKEVSKAVGAEAALLVSDAEFAQQVRDYPRAEKNLTQALKLRADVPEWWLALGQVQKQLNAPGEARAAYKKALAIYERRYDLTKSPSEAMTQSLVLVLLHRDDEAKALLERVKKKHPEVEVLQQTNPATLVERLIADPGVQQRRL